MRKLVCFGVTLALCITSVPALAQTGTSPAGYVSKEGEGFAFYLGAYGEMRYQITDENMIGTKKVIGRVSFRLDDRNHSSSTAMGRRWSKVTLCLSNGPAKTSLSRTFTMNVIGSQTMIFAAAKCWPTVTGNVATSPEPWGGINDRACSATNGTTLPYSYPASTPYLYAGTKPLLQDWTFTGGVLANGACWGTSCGRFYYLDAHFRSSVVCQTFVGYRQTKLTGCHDSSITFTSPGSRAYVSLFAWCNFSTSYPVPSYRGKSWAYSTGYFTAKGKTVINVWGIPQKNTAGVVIPGAKCENLHIDLNQPYVAWFRTAGTTSTAWSGYTPGPSLDSLLFPTLTSTFGLTVGSQAAWKDSKTGQLGLSQAYIMTTPGAPFSGTINYKKGSVYRNSSTLTTGFGPYTTTQYDMWPLPLYNAR